jgi:hypothetical protein
MMVLPNHNVYGFGSIRGLGRVGTVRRAVGNNAWGDVAAKLMGTKRA